jgi:hypothetical protein
MGNAADLEKTLNEFEQLHLQEDVNLTNDPK